ncbi:uncharacterized protein BYT42DRAFT_503825 [Radiomyces spectabilis]|uniref:uncharacterized protein n=1 Tax=Radiomyces spectabilis TaxID=64574 RepID=UPI0022208897|nr:uncharacterized protein BYT42DRAFT_503825 [Radiomyces spectabilis]KAI8368325.1 hypothetical protein BYT42DRAFT_503825 [Radiomyces spectabilis]
MAISFAWFVALYYFILDGSYPEDADKVTKQRIWRQAKRWYSDQQNCSNVCVFYINHLIIL